MRHSLARPASTVAKRAKLLILVPATCNHRAKRAGRSVSLEGIQRVITRSILEIVSCLQDSVQPHILQTAGVSPQCTTQRNCIAVSNLTLPEHGASTVRHDWARSLVGSDEASSVGTPLFEPPAAQSGRLRAGYPPLYKLYFELGMLYFDPPGYLAI